MIPSRSSLYVGAGIHVRVEAVSKWTPKERLKRKPADQELFPGLPLSGFLSLIKKPQNRFLLIFLSDFTLNSQIWLFYAER